MGAKKILIPLTALTLLGTACSALTPAPESVLRNDYYRNTALKFDGAINGQHVRKYERLDRGHTDIFIEVFNDEGIVKVYGNDVGASWSADPRIEWVAIPTEGEEREMRLYETNRITVIKDGEKTRLDWHEDIGTPVLEEAQAQYDGIMAVIDGIEEQLKQEYYDETLKPLQDWALEKLVTEQKAVPEPVVVEEPSPEPVDVERREVPRFIFDEYLMWSALAWEEQTGRALVRKYVDINDYSTYLVVDQADGTSLFFSDWLDDKHLDAFAITEGEQTVFFEQVKMRVFKGGEEQEPLNKVPPGSVWDEAVRLFEQYRPKATPKQEENQYSAEHMETWALGELQED